MKIWSLLLPFKWLIVGVGAVFGGIFYLFKKCALLIRSLFMYLFKGLAMLGKAVAFLSLWLFRGLKMMFLGLFKVIGFIFINLGIGLLTIFDVIGNAMDKLLKYLKEKRRLALIEREKIRAAKMAKQKLIQARKEEERRILLAKKEKERAEQEAKRRALMAKKEEERRILLAKKEKERAEREARRKLILAKKEEERRILLAKREKERAEQEEKRKAIMAQKAKEKAEREAKKEEERRILLAKKEKEKAEREEKRKAIMAQKAKEKAEKKEQRKLSKIKSIERRKEILAKQEKERIEQEEARKKEQAKREHEKALIEEKRKEAKLKIEQAKIKKEADRKENEIKEKEMQEKIREASEKEKEERLKKRAEMFNDLPKTIKEGFKKWLNNLSFVRDIKNRREMKRQALLIDFDAVDAVRSEKKIVYRYVAKNPEGKVEKGQLGAFSKLDVHSYLLAEGYEVYEIETAKALNKNISVNRKIKTSELVFFLTQLSTYIKSGIPLVDSIKVLSKQTRNRGVQSLYKSIIYDLTMGDSFSEALERQGNSFPKLLVNMVKSAELAGNLSETLDDMADYYSAISQTRKQMKSAMTYPAVISVFAIGVIVFILTFVIPSFIKMYKDADAEVPAITTVIINLSDFMIHNFVWLILGIIAIIVGFYFMYKNVKVFRLIVQWGLMHLPIIGNIMIYNEVTMFSKTFASLWNHNVFITSSMEILSKITNNEIYKMLIFDAITNVARGDPVSASFKNHWAFPVVAYEMLLTGERTGQPGPMMEKVAQYYQEEHKNAVNQVKAFIEPALIIFLAVVVGIILLSVVLPMFSIYGQLGLGGEGGL